MSNHTNSRVCQLAPPHSEIVLTVSRWVAGYYLEYFGPPSPMISAGIATADLLAKGRPGKARVDRYGNRVRLRRGKQSVRLEIQIEDGQGNPLRQYVGVTQGLLDAAQRDHDKVVSEARARSMEAAPQFEIGIATGAALAMITDSLRNLGPTEEGPSARSMADLLQLAKTQRGAGAALENCLHEGYSISATVAVLNALRPRDPPEKRPALRLVVDNTHSVHG